LRQPLEAEPVIDDADIADANAVKRIVFCSGKVFYDLSEGRKQLVSEPGAVATESGGTVAIIRVEQFYPFPLSAVTQRIAKYTNARDLVWCQEEPKNMGAWTFIEGKFEDLVPGGDRLRYVGRAESASPATGNYSVHTQEQERLVKEALLENRER